MVEIFCRDFTKFLGLLDLTELQGGYGEKILKSWKLRRGRVVDSESQESRIYTWYRVSGIRKLKPQKLCSQSSEIVRRDKIRAVR
jgi:hypothetical protein